MLNVGLAGLLDLPTKSSKARSTSSRNVDMADLSTESIERAMTQLVRRGYATGPRQFQFFDRRSRTAGTLKPERLKQSVQQAVLDASPSTGCFYAYGLSILDGYHSVLLVVDKTAASGRIYWLDQFKSGLSDEVTSTLDDRITTKTQTWWQSRMDTKHVGYNTTIRLWPLRHRVT